MNIKYEQLSEETLNKLLLRMNQGFETLSKSDKEEHKEMATRCKNVIDEIHNFKAIKIMNDGYLDDIYEIENGFL